tara:strand:+ start:1835 stop:2086 length:252 start_codon:yes stop_codon:yes gene_type:complete
MGTDTENTNQDINSLSFEEAYAQLNESVKQLEEGGLTLNESTQLYLAGIHLANHATKLLQKAELQIQNLMQGESEDSGDDTDA